MTISFWGAVLYGIIHELHPEWRKDGDGQGGRMGFMGAFMGVLVVGLFISVIVWAVTL